MNSIAQNNESRKNRANYAQEISENEEGQRYFSDSFRNFPLAHVSWPASELNLLCRHECGVLHAVTVPHPNQFQTHFQKKRGEGKPHRVALVATMNKMARVIHAVWRKNEPYQEPY